MANLPFIPENAPFDAAQRLWLNGFLAGLFSQQFHATTAPPPGAPHEQSRLLILFGSQTGTAEALARRLAARAAENGFQAHVVEAANGAKVDWQQEANLLVVTSTYGDGDMPDNAQAFWDWLQTAAPNALAGVNYSVLALGDRNYEQFCAAGKKFDQRLEELGATRIYPRVDCDLDYDAAAREWMNAALTALADAQSKPGAAMTPVITSTSDNLSPTPAAAASATYSRTNPFPARLIDNRKLTGKGSGKETRHFAISLEGSDLTYEAGDALGVLPSNCPSLVNDFLQILHCDGEEAVPVPAGGEVSIRKALQEFYEISRPSSELLQFVGQCHAALRDLLAPARNEDLKKWLWGRDILDLVLESRETKLSPAEFIRLLKPLAPRLYSISSSPKAHPGEVHLTVNIVRHSPATRLHKGVCSTFLADRVWEQAVVPVYVQRSPAFRLPADGDTPIIMVGPGTGVAPFRAFLHERLALGAKGRNWLIFGEQRAATDFYYRDEFESMVASRHLTRLCTAFSRDQDTKVYVQDRMWEHVQEFWAWLQEGAHFYVCGDAARMAKDVDAALHQIIATAGGLDKAGAAEFVQKLESEKRYQRDVY